MKIEKNFKSVSKQLISICRKVYYLKVIQFRKNSFNVPQLMQHWYDLTIKKNKWSYILFKKHFNSLRYTQLYLLLYVFFFFQFENLHCTLHMFWGKFFLLDEDDYQNLFILLWIGLGSLQFDDLCLNKIYFVWSLDQPHSVMIRLLLFRFQSLSPVVFIYCLSTSTTPGKQSMFPSKSQNNCDQQLIKASCINQSVVTITCYSQSVAAVNQLLPTINQFDTISCCNKSVATISCYKLSL